MKNKIDILKDIVNRKQSQKVSFTTAYGKQRKMLIDTYSASVMLAVYDKLSEDNKEKYKAMNWVQMQSTAFKIYLKIQQRSACNA